VTAHTLLSQPPPHHDEAETAVLGALFVDHGATDLVAATLKPDDFYRSKNQVVYRAILDLNAKRSPVDKVSVFTLLRARGLDKEVTIMDVDALTRAVPTSANALYYAGLVAEKARVRAALQACAWGSQHLAERHEDSDQALRAVEERVCEATRARIRDEEPSKIGTILRETFDHMQRVQNGRPAAVGTGLTDLDAMLNGGLPEGYLSILAARPGQGKSTLMVNLVRNVILGRSRAQRSQGRALLFSLEMPRIKIAQLLLACTARVNSRKLRSPLVAGPLTAEEENRVLDAAQDLERANLDVLDSASVTVSDVRARARRAHSQGGLDLIAVDYLQLMRAEGGGGRPRHEQVGEISRGLHEIANELRVPVLALSQLNRRVEERVDQRPRASDLRESGSLEQDAAVVLLLHREETSCADPERRDQLRNKATVIVAKNREGDTGDVSLYYDRACGIFGDDVGGDPVSRSSPAPQREWRDTASAAAGGDR
jgi:replicative DNA helicase